MLLDFRIQAGTRFSLRDKRLFEISEFEITRVNCKSNFICFSSNPLKTELTLPHSILEESIFDLRYVRLYGIDISTEKRLKYLQTMETLIRRRALRCLIRVCAVCQLPFFRGLQSSMG